MKYLLGIAVGLLLAFITVQFKLQSLAEQRVAPLPAANLNVLSNSTTAFRFTVPLDSVYYDVALVVDGNTKNRAAECDFGLSNFIGNCSNTRTAVDLDLTLLENNKTLNRILVRGDNQTSWWGNTLGSRLTGFKGKKANHYEVIVQTRSSLERFKELNPSIQVTLEPRLAKGLFAKASILSIISLALIVGVFVCLLVVVVLFISKKRKGNISLSRD